MYTFSKLTSKKIQHDFSFQKSGKIIIRWHEQKDHVLSEDKKLESSDFPDHVVTDDILIVASCPTRRKKEEEVSKIMLRSPRGDIQINYF
jgi:hypothetical protein